VICRPALLLAAWLVAAPAAARPWADDPGVDGSIAPLLAAVAAPAARPSPAAAAAAAGVPAALARDVAARAVERGVEPSAALEPVAAAARAGLPSELVGAKILEGLAKGAPADRILAVARALSERLAAARALLDDDAAGLALRTDRTSALADVASALAEGVGPEALHALVSAARSSGRGADGVVAAARTLGELAHRGVPIPDALPLAEALASRPPLPAGEVAALYDAYRAEGGHEPRAFLDEAALRTRSGASLSGMVDWFGDTRDKVVRLKDRPDTSGAPGVTGPASQRGVGPSGTPPGLEERPHGRGKAKPK
jgi:hypothetical protein